MIITVEDFKKYFYKDNNFDFQPYPTWDIETTYGLGDLVLYQGSDYKYHIYKSKEADNLGHLPTDSTYWTLSNESVDFILDQDIEKAMGEGSFYFNEAIFGNAEKAKIYFLYITAFFLVYDNDTAGVGLDGSDGSAGPVIHRTVGKMSVSYAQSTLFKQYPDYEFLSKNAYGIKAFNIVRKYLRGNVQIVTSHGVAF